jgi:Kef-type K+ transport system membrane component KefB
MENIFVQIGIMIILATIGGMLARIIRQPLIPAYIIAGILIGPGLNLITNTEIIDLFGLAGIAFLLFIVGLELSFDKLRDIGHIATMGTLVQVAVLFSFGYVVAGMLGYLPLESVYVGFIVAFSSTMVVIKLLSDKHELNSLHGRIVIGMLIMQDIIAILALSMLSGANGITAVTLLVSIAKAIGVIITAFLASKFLFPHLFKFAARSQELLFLSAVSTCFLFSIIFELIGFSIAIGAFIAGVSLANLPYTLDIISKVKSLRDFFAILFFSSLGMGLVFADIPNVIIPLIILSFIVLLLKPFVLMVLGSFFGYTKRTSFMTSISLAQVSEFSLILVAAGMIHGHLSQEIVTLSILLAIVTISITSYFIKFDHQIYNFLGRFLGVFDVMSTGKHLEYIKKDKLKYDVLLVGYDRIGYNIFYALERMKKTFLIVDFNPDIIKKLVARKIPCLYGDIGDDEVIKRVSLKHVKLIVSTVPTRDVGNLLIRRTRRVNHKALIFVTAETVSDALYLYEAGADYVILPHYLGGEKVSDLIQDIRGGESVKQILKNKLDHMHELKHRTKIKYPRHKKK